METMLYILILIITGIMLFLSVYFIITLSDLECDYLNATECCQLLNRWILPRLGGQLVLTLLHGFSGDYVMFPANALFTLGLVYQWYFVPVGNLNVYDPVEIHYRGQVKTNIRYSLFILGWYLANFFIGMYLCILSVLRDGNPEDMAKMVAEGITPHFSP